jgi:hypothetical protein
MSKIFVDVLIDGVLPFVQIQLLNTSLSPVPLAHNLWKTRVRLEPGTYTARFATSSWENETPFLVLPNETEIVVSPTNLDGISIRSAAPLEGTHAFDRDHARATAAVTRIGLTQPSDRGDEGSIVVVARRTRMLTPQTTTDLSWDTEIALFSGAGEKVFLRDFVVPDLPGSLHAVNIPLGKGPYQVRFAEDTSGKFVAQSIFVVPGWQTRLFLLDESTSNEPIGNSWATARFSIHFSPIPEVFLQSSPALLVADELMNVLAHDAFVMPGPEWPAYLGHANCATLDLAFYLARLDPWRKDALADSDVTMRLSNLRGVVDAEVAIQAARAESSDNTYSISSATDRPYVVSDLPMSVRGWDLALFAETRNSVVIPRQSRASREATQVLSAGPWLRFSMSSEHSGEQLSAERDRTDDSPSSLCSNPNQILLDLREFVMREPAARIQFGAIGFSSVERRFLNLVCPHVNTTVFRLLTEMDKSGGMAVKDDPVACNLESLPSEEVVVQALRLPRAVIREIAIEAVVKLVGRTRLPTTPHLDTFITQESNEQPLLLEPLEALRTEPSEILHLAERTSLPLLSLLYLRYRGFADKEDVLLTVSEIAEELSRLGFQVQATRRPVRSKDVDQALRKAIKQLSTFHRVHSTTEDTEWETLEVSVSPISRYAPGRLFIVRRRPARKDLTPALEKQWVQNVNSYSLSLGSVPEVEKGPGESANSPRSEIYRPHGRPAYVRIDAQTRYEAAVRQFETTSIDELAMVLETAE